MRERAGDPRANPLEAPKFRRNRASLGAPGTRIDVVGLTGLDYYVSEGSTPLPLRRGEKQTMVFTDAQKLLADAGLAIDPKSKGLGQTGANVAIGLTNLGEIVTLHTPLSVRDDSTKIIFDALSAYSGLEVDATPHEGRNPLGIHVVDEATGDKKALLDKEPAPLIPNFNNPGFILLAATSGAWEVTANYTLDYTKANDIPYGMIASESQLKQLATDPVKRDTYLRALKGTSIWLGNDDEAKLIIKSYGQSPSDDPEILARQLRDLGEGIPYVSITYGATHSTLLTESHFHTLFNRAVKAKNTAGAGDQYAAVLVHGLRNISDTSQANAIGGLMMEASYATIAVVLVNETTTNQLTLDGERRLRFSDPKRTETLERLKFYDHSAYPLRRPNLL